MSSVRIETRGGHDHVTVWVRGQCAGTLVVDAGQGVQLIWPLGPWQDGVMQG